MAHLVNTNVLVDLTRGNRAAADYLDSLGDAWSISMITGLELLAGARTQRETNDLDVVLERLPRDPAHGEHRAPGVRADEGLYAIPRSVSAGALIAATALEEGLKLASKNRKHFEMIDGLDLELPVY